MNLRSSALFVATFCCLFTAKMRAQNYQPSPENIEARSWFQDARFGLFIHWGVYSILGDGEWVMNNQNISVEEYEKLPTFFNPIDFDPVEWVTMVKEAGMKYITITSRHHDGFSMFDSQMTDYDIVDSTPYGKDVDWNRDDYYPRGRTGTGIQGRGEGQWEDYIAFMKGQLKELLTNYGEIGGIWFDGHWDQKEWDGKTFGKVKVDWHYNEIYGMIHEIQPQALIGNNHHIGVIDGEDFQMFEKDLPGKNTTGWGTPADQIGAVPLEVCETINGSWGFNLQDRKHKTDKELIHYLIKAAGYGSNLLLNVGPMPNGKIQPKHQTSLKAMGAWLKEYGNTIYGTHKGPIPANDDFVSTQKGKSVFVHLLSPSVEIIHADEVPVRIKGIYDMKTNTKLPYRNDSFGLAIDVSKLAKDDIDTVIKIVLR